MTKNTPITYETTTITPAIAEAMLAKNTHNRSVKQSNLKKVMRALQNGEWKLNGEAVKVATDGMILDGQHRLLACIQTGISFDTFVIRGLASETQDTMDTGSPRSAGDVLKLRGESNYVPLAAIAKKVNIYTRGGFRAATVGSTTITSPEIVRTVDMNPGLRDIAKRAQSDTTRASVPAGLLGLLMFVFYDIDGDDAEFFFDRLAGGEHLAKGDPIYELRARLKEVKDIRGTKSQTFMAAIAIKAWNKYRDGETISLLKYTVGGANPEKFPEPK